MFKYTGVREVHVVHIHVCMCTCVCACVHVCVHVCVSVCHVNMGNGDYAYRLVRRCARIPPRGPLTTFAHLSLQDSSLQTPSTAAAVEGSQACMGGVMPYNSTHCTGPHALTAGAAHGQLSS